MNKSEEEYVKSIETENEKLRKKLEISPTIKIVRYVSKSNCKSKYVRNVYFVGKAMFGEIAESWDETNIYNIRICVDFGWGPPKTAKCLDMDYAKKTMLEYIRGDVSLKELKASNKMSSEDTPLSEEIVTTYDR